MPARAPGLSLMSLLTAALLTAAAPSGTHARDVQELLTPRDWEDLQRENARSTVRSTANAPDIALDDDELIVPSGWRVGVACTCELGGSGELCSELLVPVDWSALHRAPSARPHA